MNQQELKAKFNPTNVNLGVLNDGDIVPYAVQNNSEFDILGIKKSCGCVGTIVVGPRIITGDFPAKYKEGTQELYKVDGSYCQKLRQGAADKFYNVEQSAWVDDPNRVEGPFKAHQFTQTITVKMKQDGVPDELPDANGELQDNPERLKCSIPVTSWILKPVS